MFPLLTACENDSVDMAKLLIDAGANVNKANGVCCYGLLKWILFCVECNVYNFRKGFLC